MKRFFGFFTIVAVVTILICGCDSAGGSDIEICTITSANATTETIKSGSTVTQNVYFTWDYTGTLESFSFVARIAGTIYGYKTDSTSFTKFCAQNVSPGTTFEVTITPSNGSPYYFIYTTPAETVPVDNTITPDHAANSKTDIYDVTKENTISLTGNDIKEIFLVKTNPTETNSTSTRYIKEIFIETSTILQSSRNIAEINESYNYLETDSDDLLEQEGLNIIHFVDEPVVKKPLVKSNAARNIASDEILQASAADYDFSWLKIKGELGEKLTFFGYTSATSKSAFDATLRYIDNENKCYVWVADDCYTTETASNPEKRLSDSHIQALLKAFTDNADYVRNIFGNEADILLCPNEKDAKVADVELTTASAFGDYVNFLIYDLYGDFTGEKPQSGILGFFTNADYYETDESVKKRLNDEYSPTDIRKYSNGGKFLHIDAPWTISYLDSMKSTIVHEFQHLIQYGQKEIWKDINRSETWFSEMSSMLCEDMMQEKLGVEDRDSPKVRTWRFNDGYAKKSMMSYDSSSSDMVLCSYATSYIFGAYLARKYGGADFVYDVMHNDKVGTEALLTEIQKQGGNWESVFRDFAADLLTSDVLNKTERTTIHKMSNYDYPMKGFNIYDNKYKVTGDSYAGPIIYDAMKNTNTTIYSYGLNLSTYVPSVAYNKLTISFDGESGTGVKEYLVVVKQ